MNMNMEMEERRQGGTRKILEENLRAGEEEREEGHKNWGGGSARVPVPEAARGIMRNGGGPHGGGSAQIYAQIGDRRGSGSGSEEARGLGKSSYNFDKR